MDPFVIQYYYTVLNRRSTSEGSSIEADSRHCQPVAGSDGIPSDHTEDDWSRGSSEDPDSEVDSGQNIRGDHRNEISELDRKVKYLTSRKKNNILYFGQYKLGMFSINTLNILLVK